jgi:hypothetical protein
MSHTQFDISPKAKVYPIRPEMLARINGGYWLKPESYEGEYVWAELKAYEAANDPVERIRQRISDKRAHNLTLSQTLWTIGLLALVPWAVLAIVEFA